MVQTAFMHHTCSFVRVEVLGYNFMLHLKIPRLENWPHIGCMNIYIFALGSSIFVKAFQWLEVKFIFPLFSLLNNYLNLQILFKLNFYFYRLRIHMVMIKFLFKDIYFHFWDNPDNVLVSIPAQWVKPWKYFTKRDKIAVLKLGVPIQPWVVLGTCHASFTAVFQLR